MRSHLDGSRVDSTSGATSACRSPSSVQAGLMLLYNDRAPSFERPVLRSLPGTCSGQVLPRHTRGSPYRCSLPGLAGFDDSRCVGPNLQRRPVKLIQHDPPSRGNSTPLKRIAGYRAPLTPRLARPSRKYWRRGRDSNPGHRDHPCTAFPVPHLRPLGHPSTFLAHRNFDDRWKNWRRGEDLNPRGTFWAPIRFRVGRLRPGSATPPH